MAKYRVLRPWVGVKKHDIVELSKLNPAIKAQVELVGDDEEVTKQAEPAKRRGRPPGSGKKLTVNPASGEGSKEDGDGDNTEA